MSKQIEVTKIEINVRGKVLSLTPDEMRELKDVLEQAFPSTPKVTEKHYHHHDYYRWPIWYGGSIDTGTPKYDYWKVTCSTDGIANLSVT